MHPNPPPPLPPPLDHLIPHNHHTRHQEVAGSRVDRKGLTGCGPLTLLLIRRLRQRDIPREIYLPLPLLAVEQIMMIGE